MVTRIEIATRDGLQDPRGLETRRQIRAALASELEALPEAPRDELVAALRALLSFAYWQELRRHGSQSRAATRRVTAQMIGAVVSAAEKR